MENYSMFIDWKNNIVKMVILFKALYKINAITTNISMTFFKDLEQILVKFVWNCKIPQRAKAI